MNTVLLEVLKLYKQLQKISTSSLEDSKWDDSKNSIKRSEMNVSKKNTNFPATPMFLFKQDGTSEASESDVGFSLDDKSSEEIQPNNNDYNKVAQNNASSGAPKKRKSKEKNQIEKAGVIKKIIIDTNVNRGKLRGLSVDKIPDEFSKNDDYLVTFEFKAKEANNTSGKLANLSQRNNNNVKKVIYAESFPRDKIWQDIVDEKPLKLRAESEMTEVNGDVTSTPSPSFTTTHHHNTGTVIGENTIKFTTSVDITSNELNYMMRAMKMYQHKNESKRKFSHGTQHNHAIVKKKVNFTFYYLKGKFCHKKETPITNVKM